MQVQPWVMGQVCNIANGTSNKICLFTLFSSYLLLPFPSATAFFLASFSPPSGRCLLPLSSQPTPVCCSPGRCRGPRPLFDKQRLISKERVRSAGHAAGSSGFPPQQRAEVSSSSTAPPPACPLHPRASPGHGGQGAPFWAKMVRWS